jgi:kinesin family protein 4/21/27
MQLQHKNVIGSQERATQERVQRLQSELNDMKRTKTELMQRMRDEARRAADVEQRRVREVAGLQREARKRDTRIRDLEQKQRQKELMLKRKQEEVSSLRRQAETEKVRRLAASAVATTTRMRPTQLMKAEYQSRMTPTQLTPVSSRLARRYNNQLLPFSLRHARNKWLTLEQQVYTMRIASCCSHHAQMSSLVVRRRSCVQIEMSLERLLARRDAVRARMVDTTLEPDERDAAAVECAFVQRQISEAQQELVQIDDGDDKVCV